MATLKDFQKRSISIPKLQLPLWQSNSSNRPIGHIPKQCIHYRSISICKICIY